MSTSPNRTDSVEEVAIIGMVGRFPGARNVEEFWRNLENGVESISHFSLEELEPSRLEPPGIRFLPNYVRARGVLEDVDKFDAAFFDIMPQEAAVMDPQHRLFLEAAWEALEHSGYDPTAFAGAIGVWAGMSSPTYYLENILPRLGVVDQVGLFQAMLANETDFLSTRVSYKLNLRGPSVSVQTGCSTALVAVCHAYQGLVTYQCDMALAGGVSVSIPQRRGYLYQEGAIGSPDGRCRAFDAASAGTVFGDGVGIVVLKRLREALEDRDTVYAVIKGAALNNDGSRKAGYAAPSVDGQAEVIAMAQALAGVDPGTISYVEAHGTATPLGDPIEIAALTQAFRAGTAKKRFCAVGSVKSNIGHSDSAAGVAGLIKTALALHHRTLPPSLHFTRPNPQIDFANSPFYVNTQLQPWKSGAMPRRAGVSSFGIGGTNAHVVLEEAAAAEPGGPARDCHLLVLSARSAAALDRAAAQLKDHLAGVESVDLADAAYTLQVGRRAFSHRRALVCRDRNEAVHLLAQPDPKRVFTGNAERPPAGIAFLFPGQGAQYVNMGRTLYDSEALFRTEVDECSEVLRPHLGLDLRTILYPPEADVAAAQTQITQTAITQPALFVIEYALARLWMSWGIEPAAMIGHSLGEYVAACLAGVFTRDAAATLVAARGRLIQQQSPGTMMAVRMPVVELEPKLSPEVVIAALNAPELTVVSGPYVGVRALENHLKTLGIMCTVLATSHAFHSPMMDGALSPFREALGKVRLAPPRLPWVSCLTGNWITSEQAVDPDYWVQQLRQPVRFSDGVRLLGNNPSQILLEVGPGHTLSSLVRQHRTRPAVQSVVASLGPGPGRDVPLLLEAAGRLWICGAQLDWPALHRHERCRRIPLPTYPFERRRHWINPLPLAPDAKVARAVSVASSWPSENNHEETSMLTSSVASLSATATSVAGRLQALLSIVSGIPASEIDFFRSFLELDFDSLVLTQTSGAVLKSFGVDVPFRLLLEDLPTPNALAEHIEAHLAAPLGEDPESVPRATAGRLTRVAPIYGARLGRDAAGKEAWFVPDPDRPGNYLQVKIT